ncbi:hypothetical protein [Sorangium sp. So ce854]|uniref:hypothetical protein n=1 Tax=Sorangium sp. So ce854 TaxID=3133322 RepID=UPI003F60E51A
MSSSTDVVSALDVALRVAAALESLGCAYFSTSSAAASRAPFKVSRARRTISIGSSR